MEKPLILAFDTSGPYCAAALLSGDAVITQTVEEMKKGESNILVALRMRPLLSREIGEG